MAGAPAKSAPKAAQQHGSTLSTLIVVAIVTVFGAGAGMGLVWVLKPSLETRGAAEHTSVGAKTRGDVLLELPSIIAQLRGDQKSWVRLDASVVVAPDVEAQQIGAAVLADDFLAYLQTLSVDDLSPPAGMRLLREDLQERARIRTRGRAKEVLFRSFIIE